MTSESAAPPIRRGPAPTKHLDVLWAAVGLFSRRGVAQTTTREIAAAAGTTERTLFKHFGSKEGLVHAVIAEAVVAHLAPLSLDALRQAIEAHDGDIEQWHAALLQARAQAAAQAPELTRLLLVELLRDQRLLDRFAQEWLAAVWQPLLALFRRLQCEDRLRRDLPAEALARMFLSLNIGLLVGRYVLAPQAAWDDRRDIAAVAAFFGRGAAPGDSTRPAGKARAAGG
jgi:AcrR family transcriptional regulator